MTADEIGLMAALKGILTGDIIEEVKQMAADGIFQDGSYSGPCVSDITMQRANFLVAIDRYEDALRKESEVAQ